MALRSSRIIHDIESLTISQGRLRGKQFKVWPWEKRFVRGLAKNDIAALCIARGDGKSTLASGIGCSALKPDGEMAQDRGEIIIVASSLKQARIPFRHVKFFMADIIAADRKRWRLIDNSHQAEIEDRETGTVLQAIGSDAKKAHGLAPSLVLADEPAKWESGGREMYAALKDGFG